MIHPDSAFHYVARIDAGSITDGEITVQAATAEGWRGGSLAGRAPRLRFWDGLLTLVSTTDDAQVKWFSYHLGDVVARAARPGDTIEVVRDFNGSLALVLRRDGALIAAVGSLTTALVGPEVELRPDGPATEVRAGDERRVLRERESALIGAYDVYFELQDCGGIGTPSACYSIALAPDAVLVNAARRSAVLLAHQVLDRLRGERADGTYLRD